MPKEEPYVMPAADFERFLDLMNLSERAAVEVLGISRPSIARYKREGAPLVVALACAAIARGLKPWPN